MRFDGRRNNLHSVWDTSIPVKIVGRESDGVEDEKAQAREWAATLASRGPGRGGGSRGSCTDVGTAERCALVWARDANRFICSYVLKDDVEGVADRELGGEYFDGAVSVVEGLVARAGYRLGRWIEGLAKEREEMMEMMELEGGQGVVVEL